ncbi:EthD family reductase [Paenactinomyces guangxiensis]|uniref:EthD family reductase n=1 Tax=Paenactinomyces guangxiensis TaxID=1490290 RepID=A0A7W1WP05_9BACL|nr:EthD family reductase [Paenactinomyces guangxiensis]MBA4493407.1 EthD family reductase [Paenactinomyces guangxiensis]MBH8590498.1 EthD family reductase [Paenactinomyces guangxiensis]
MVKLVALYKQPEELKAFDEHYFNTHLPLTNKMPGLIRANITKFSGTPMGEQSPYYLQADLYFESMEALQNSMQSPEGKAAAKDLMGFAGKLVTMMVGEEVNGESQ